MTIYFSSDLHFGHENIIGLTGRPFETSEEMEAVLIDNINSVVGVDDTLYLLGDISFKITRDRAAELLGQINCKNVHLITGNHDKNWADTKIFKSVQDYLELKIDGRKIVLFHYPIAEWNGFYHGAIHLHGHIHSTGSYNLENINAGRLIYDVGVDANDFEPISLDDILGLFNLE